jgi:hypothetical protein
MSLITKFKIVVAVIFVFMVYNYFFNHHTKTNIIKLYRAQLSTDENIMNEIISFMKQKDSTCPFLILDYVGHNEEPLFLTCNETYYDVNANSPDEINDYIDEHRSVMRLAGATIFGADLVDYQLNPYYLVNLENSSQKKTLEKLRPNWSFIIELKYNWYIVKSKK